MPTTGANEIILQEKNDLIKITEDNPRRIILIDSEDALIEGRRYRDGEIHWRETILGEVRIDEIVFPVLVLFIK